MDIQFDGKTFIGKSQKEEREILMFENFNNKVMTNCLSEDNEGDKIFYVDVEKRGGKKSFIYGKRGFYF